MSKLIFINAVMNSGKTARLIERNFDYNRISKRTMIFKPSTDTRETSIKSRNGLETECNIIHSKKDFKLIKDVDIVLIDEAQFLKSSEVEALRKISIKQNITIYCFGLKTDFMGKLFKGSKKLIELADEIEDLNTMCLCGEKATMNLKYDNKTGTIIKTGNSIDCGYEDMYMSVCYKHWSCKNINQIK